VRRITVEEVTQAYRETGLTPAIGTFGMVSSRCGCAITALLLYENQERGVSLEEIISSLEKGTTFGEIAESIRHLLGDLDKFYLLGFVNGFDGLPMVCSEMFSSEDDPSQAFRHFQIGYEDGVQVREAIFVSL